VGGFSWHQQRTFGMRKLTAILLLAFVVCVAGIVVLLGTVDLPAPTAHMEVPISNDRLAP
jgi:hypothetical protein